MPEAVPFITVVVPCRNEANYIARCLDSILANDVPTEQMEVLVVDGQSDDRTRHIVQDYARRHPVVRLLSNPARIVPTALNVAIAAARGSVIVRMDAHNEYPTDYISGLVGWLQRSGADNVGAAWTTRAANDTLRARAIAAALSHPFGIGNAQFRLGTQEPREVDTVPFGCYRREVFDRIGLFDEELVRNQDDEFNFRLIRAGGRVLLVPGLVSQYYARATLQQLARMYYQYGYFKPLVVWKVRRIMTARQLLPAALVLSLAVTGLAMPWSAVARVLFFLVGGSYVAANLLAAACAVRVHGPKCAAALVIVFPVIHWSYGVGYVRGALSVLFSGFAATRRPTDMAPSRW